MHIEITVSKVLSNIFNCLKVQEKNAFDAGTKALLGKFLQYFTDTKQFDVICLS